MADSRIVVDWDSITAGLRATLRRTATAIEIMQSSGPEVAQDPRRLLGVMASAQALAWRLVPDPRRTKA